MKHENMQEVDDILIKVIFNLYSNFMSIRIQVLRVLLRTVLTCEITQNRNTLWRSIDYSECGLFIALNVMRSARFFSMSKLTFIV